MVDVTRYEMVDVTFVTKRYMLLVTKRYHVTRYEMVDVTLPNGRCYSLRNVDIVTKR